MSKHLAKVQSLYTPEQLALGERYYQCFRGQSFGANISDCFSPLGAAMWSHFIRMQEQAYREKSSSAVYDIVKNEISAIHNLGGHIAQIIMADPAFDYKNLVIIEKGSGSKDAVRNKTFVQLKQIEEAGGHIAMYSPWEKSEFFLNETCDVFKKKRPNIFVNPQNVDFTKDDPDLSMAHDTKLNTENPRIAIENGTSRSNIATSSPNEVPFDALRAYFRHDRIICRDGGMLILNCDGDQNGKRNVAKYEDAAHAQVGQIYPHFGQRQGVISKDFEPLSLYYKPIWEEKRHLIRHTLIASADQTFKVLRDDGQFHEVSFKENDGHDGHKNVFSHSIKWTPEIMCLAAEMEGFKTLMAKADNPQDPQNYTYVFKAK